jgi:hypothetical protein
VAREHDSVRDVVTLVRTALALATCDGGDSERRSKPAMCPGRERLGSSGRRVGEASVGGVDGSVVEATVGGVDGSVVQACGGANVRVSGAGEATPWPGEDGVLEGVGAVVRRF